MIEARGLRKQYGATVAVDDLSFTVRPGQVTGFLGPNGSGKSTTMRLILGLDEPNAGTVTVNGKPYRSFRRPLLEVGALLEATAAQSGRSARNHLRWLALSNGIRTSRVDEVLEKVGLGRVADRRVGGFSLGMRQRLGIAAALLGDPPVLMLDEPVNGLDPEGVLWVRNLVRSLAAEGRTVFLSSHLMSEMAITADALVIIGRGRLIAETRIEELLTGASGSFVRARSPQAELLATLLRARGAQVQHEHDGTLHVFDLSADTIGQIAMANGVTLGELSFQQVTLEQRYMELTREAIDFSGANRGPTPDSDATRDRG